ncbi:extracellular solute-binding protein [Actinoplanes sp. NBC_00393]|uniref:ABC transporter substrate-binding protein n=1 Tax=Actinoplanes sp. NBC_00393 TaxID=2975953 RepID=UPI002E1C84D1
MTDSAFNRRTFLTLSGGAALAAGLSACTGGGASDAPTNTGSKELRLFTYEDNSTIDLLKAQIKQFDTQNGTTTTVDSLPGSGAAVYPDKLRTELLGGTGPDVWRIWGGQIGAPFVKAKQAMDLSAYYDKYGWASKLNPAAVSGMTFEGLKGGLPYIALGIGAWYNKAAFAKAGVTAPPTSYEELEEANARILASGVTPLGTAGKYGWHVMRLYEYLLEVSAGPELHDKLLTGAESWDRPEVVTAFTNFKKWQDQKWIPEGAIGLDPADVELWYVQGKTAYTITGPWTEAQGIQAGGKKSADFGVFPFPTGHEPARHSGFVEGYMINAKAGNPDMAAALLDFLIKPETQKAMNITASIVAGAEPDQATLPLSYEWSQGSGKQPFYTIQDQAFPKKQADQYFAIQSDVLQGKTNPAEAAKQMQVVIKGWQK